MSTKVNYNDGKWHGWNQGERPVHPNSMIDVYHLATGSPLLTKYQKAGDQIWKNIIAFKVVRVYHEPPKEFWISLNDYQAYETLKDYQRLELCPEHGYIHTVEIREDN